MGRATHITMVNAIGMSIEHRPAPVSVGHALSLADMRHAGCMPMAVMVVASMPAGRNASVIAQARITAELLAVSNERQR